MRTALALCLLLLPTFAAAQVSPCVKMKDPIGCNCALTTGGTVGATSWARGSDRGAFEACLASRDAKPASTRPASIPGRF